MEIQVVKEEKTTILKPIGNLDLDGMAKFKEAISQARKDGANNLIVDFEGVTQIQSTQLQSLVAPVKALFLMQGRIIFCNLGKQERIIKNSMLNSMLKFCATLDDAKAASGAAD